MPTLEEWYQELKDIADIQDLGWLLTEDMNNYQKPFDDGMDPDEYFEYEKSAAAVSS